MSYWFNPYKPQSTIAISTRIRLARNIMGIPFPSQMSPEQFKTVNDLVRSAICDCEEPIAKNLKYISMNDIPKIERFAMVERHIISKNFASNYQNRAIIISEDESICVMLGEEDHIRIQVLFDGMQLERAYNIANSIDKILCNRLNIAFDSRIGFLTACPTNVGTGLRASVMLHLPMIGDNMKNFSNIINQNGFTIRGMYGEGTKALASLYQISNQKTLGMSENDAIKNLKIITQKALEKENTARRGINKLWLEDKVMRSYGVLKNARLLTSEELLSRISDVILGVGMGVVESKIWPIELLVNTQPNMLMKKLGEMSPESRDIERATMIRNLL